jgi:hypothetical protein
MGLNGSKDAVPQPSRRLVKLENKLRERYGLESGGTQRPDGLVDAGWATCRGKRSLNEDTCYCCFHKLFLVKTSKLTNAKSNVIAVDFGARARKAA